MCFRRAMAIRVLKRAGVTALCRFTAAGRASMPDSVALVARLTLKAARSGGASRPLCARKSTAVPTPVSTL